ncbi:MAG: hypothetical protein ACRDYA_18535 [Egibacteraceae bacterium]
MKSRGRCLMLVLIGVALLAGCAQPRSREAFCETLVEEKQRYRDTYSERLDQVGRDGDLSLSVALGTSLEALRDVAATFDKLEKAAPEEIRPDVETLRDALQRQRDALNDLADNPLGALAGSLTSGLATMSSWERVSTYVEQNCGTRL